MPTSNYLDRFLDALVATFSPEVAEQIVGAKAPDELHFRIEQLAEGAEVGTLSADEEIEYKRLVEALDIVSIIQAKARRMSSPLPSVATTPISDRHIRR